MAVASGRVGHVLIERGQVIDKGMSSTASQDIAEVRRFAARRIELLRPDIIVTERLPNDSKKGLKTRMVITAMTAEAEASEPPSLVVERVRRTHNRFEEAAQLCRVYPEMQILLPRKRKPWESEPKALIYFEALALIEAGFAQLT
ncbi:hypothetical protein ATO10_05906 [Actibacterium atlanticum]|uniref:Uncharacterized protein n=1 Tax=Actibacterium atlanticum TaxID=1461693 RepID=A0A058ZMM7_9RHOB|nr:hypothetical protein [Actibacterium atlanticum]KCV82452.1 hypothetical protein ATO10_05906 [Actibacterium atlanticum]